MEPPTDSQLAASAPPIAPRTPDLARELSHLAVEAEPAASTRRRLRSRLALTGVAALGLVGLSAGASAAGVLPAPEWAPWYETPATSHTQTVTSGAVCDVDYGIKAHDPSEPATRAAEAAAVAEAEHFLRRFDFSTINVAKAVESVPTTAVQPEDGPEERETFAVQFVLGQRLEKHLAGQGLPTTAVSVSAALSCEDGGE